MSFVDGESEMDEIRAEALQRTCLDDTDEDLEEDNEVDDDFVGANEAEPSIDNVVNKNEGSITPADFFTKEFDDSESFYNMYCEYTKSVGFGVRKGDAARDVAGSFVRRYFLCNKTGEREKKHYKRVDRKRQPKLETRVRYPAKLMVYLDQGKKKWKVRKMEVEHNHELLPPRYVHLIPSFRRIADHDKIQVDNMLKFGLPTSMIMGFLAGQASGFGHLSFSNKDLYNYVDKQRCGNIIDRDAAAAISYLQGRADADLMTFATYTRTKDNRLEHLFWSDWASQLDYQLYGNVLAFDATYRKNKYRKPLVIFSGSNNHRQTCIFGFALLDDEKSSSYKWLLRNFLNVMKNKQPTLVVTDGDEAMKNAIEEVLTESSHHCVVGICKRMQRLKSRSLSFHEFKVCIYGNFTIDESEEQWAKVIERFDLKDNTWVAWVSQRKEMWAYAYLRSKFCAGFRTTSRCEGINSIVKRFTNSTNSIHELVLSLERVVKDYRNNAIYAKFKSLYSQPVLSTGLYYLESQAATIYT